MSGRGGPVRLGMRLQQSPIGFFPYDRLLALGVISHPRGGGKSGPDGAAPPTPFSRVAQVQQRGARVLTGSLEAAGENQVG